MAEAIVRYGAYTEEQVDADSATVGELSGSILVKLEQGDNVFRFLPPPIGKKSPFRMTSMHYVDVPGTDKTITLACPRYELREPCVVCAESQRLRESPNPLDRERGRRLEGNLRVYAAVLLRTPGWEENPILRVIGFGSQIYNQLKALRKNVKLGGDFTNPLENGFDIIIHREGSGANDTRYSVGADRASSPLHPDPVVMQELIDNQPDLENLVNPVASDELMTIMGQVGGGRTPYTPTRQQVGADVARQRERYARQRTAVSDARAEQEEQEEQEELDDDFNPIRR